MFFFSFILLFLLVLLFLLYNFEFLANQTLVFTKPFVAFKILGKKKNIPFDSNWFFSVFFVFGFCFL
jgi:hypothetical protein